MNRTKSEIRLCDVCNKPLPIDAKRNQKRHPKCKPEYDKQKSKIAMRNKRNKEKGEKITQILRENPDVLDKVATNVLDRINMDLEIYMGKPDEKGRQRGIAWRVNRSHYPDNIDKYSNQMKKETKDGRIKYIMIKDLEDQMRREEEQRAKIFNLIVEQNKKLKEQNDKIIKQNSIINSDINKVKKKLKME